MAFVARTGYVGAKECPFVLHKPGLVRAVAGTRRLSSRLARVATIAVAGTLFATAGAGAAPDAQPPAVTEKRDVVQTTFKSVDATVAGEWDFPVNTPAPLAVLIPTAGRLDRDGWAPGMGDVDHAGIYEDLAAKLVAAGFAVFRYDKPGAGRSTPARFATERSNALEAYTHAVQHLRVDPDKVFLLGHGLGTDTIAAIYPRFESVLPPAGVVLFDSRVGETDATRITAPLLVVNPGKDPDDRYQYGEFVVEAREKHDPPLPTELVLLPDAERGLVTPRTVRGRTTYTLDPRAVDAALKWLRRRLLR